MPAVSVIIPVYNRERRIGRAIESVISQTYQDVEILVIDDGSIDGTPRVLAGFGDQIVYLRQENRGPYAARNVGVVRASGEYIAFLDSDDIWYPPKLEKQVAILRREPEVGLVYTNGYWVDEPSDGRSGEARRLLSDIHALHSGDVFRDLIRNNFVGTSSVVVRRACFLESGGFDETVPLAADYYKWLQIAREHALAAIEEPLLEYRVHDDNISRDRIRSLRCQRYLMNQLGRDVGDREVLALVRARRRGLLIELWYQWLNESELKLARWAHERGFPLVQLTRSLIVCVRVALATGRWINRVAPRLVRSVRHAVSRGIAGRSSAAAKLT